MRGQKFALEEGEILLKEGRAASGWGAAAGKLYLTTQRLYWKRGRFQFLFGGYPQLSIPLQDIVDCDVTGGTGFYYLKVEVKTQARFVHTVEASLLPPSVDLRNDILATEQHYFVVKGGLPSPLVIFHRKTAREWKQAVRDAIECVPRGALEVSEHPIQRLI